MKRISGFLRGLTRLSLRAKLIIANTGLATLVIVTIGFLAVRTASQSSSYLSAQFTESERQRVEDRLGSSAEGYARDLNEFFASIETSMTILGSNMVGIFAQEELIGEGQTWDARASLTMLPGGSWDNANEEAGSIFLPAGASPEANYQEINTLKQLDFIAPGLLANNPDAIAVYFGSARGETFYYPNVDLATLLPPDFNITKRPWYEAAAPGKNEKRGIVWSLPYVDAAANGLVVTSSVPVYDEFGQFRGAAAIDLQLTRITDLVSDIRYGSSGYAFVIDGEGHLIALSSKGYADLGVTADDIETGAFLDTSLMTNAPLELFRVLAKMASFQSGIATLELGGTQKYIAYRPIPSIGYSLGLVVDVAETQQNVITAQKRIEADTRGALIGLTAIMGGIWLLFLFLSHRLGTAVIAPLTELTRNARRIADGDLTASLRAASTDEVGMLASTLNTMTSNLRAVIEATEQRVTERTSALQRSTEESTRRAQVLKTISDVARAISAETKLESLLERVTNLVSETFGFYHVGVFLIDPAKGSAVLRAANSPGGKKMLARGHALKVGQVGIVGYATGEGRARIALDVGADAVFFDNPDLPQTRSEMALPLKVRERVIGALDVQSLEVNAFAQEDVDTISILADQIAIAIENARLLGETQQALAEIQAVYGESISRAWERKTASAPLGYQYSAAGGRQVREPLEPEHFRFTADARRARLERGADGAALLAVPLRLHNQVIGLIHIRAADSANEWKEDEIAIVEATAERLALALENARLFEETSGRAAREHAVAEITSKIRQTNDPQAMIRTAVQELQRVLGVTRVEIVPQTVPAPLQDEPANGKVEQA
ncbi:MAG: hypothetical protein HFACDABA_01130 [Anaerolineales bacterium]|nr:hypothetical protein [Anaerolineales bacterium]